MHTSNHDAACALARYEAFKHSPVATAADRERAHWDALLGVWFNVGWFYAIGFVWLPELVREARAHVNDQLGQRDQHGNPLQEWVGRYRAPGAVGSRP